MSIGLQKVHSTRPLPLRTGWYQSGCDSTNDYHFPLLAVSYRHSAGSPFFCRNLGLRVALQMNKKHLVMMWAPHVHATYAHNERTISLSPHIHENSRAKALYPSISPYMRYLVVQNAPYPCPHTLRGEDLPHVQELKT